MAELVEAGVEPCNHREAIDGTTAHGRAMLQMSAAFAELEREMIRDRVKAGLARVKAQGRQLGHPRLPDTVRWQVRDMRAEGVPIRRIAAECSMALSTVQSVLEEADFAA